MHTARLFRAMGRLGIGLIVWLAANSVVHADAIELQHERNVDIAMRDGVRLKADVFRPVKDGKYPVILSVTAYQKDMLWIPPESHNARPGPYQNWETPNPERWVPEGYVLVRLDTRGTGQSPGLWNPASPEEAVDVHRDVQSKLSLGCHWGTYQLTDEPVMEPARRLQECKEKRGIPDQAFRVLPIGGTVTIPPSPTTS